MAKRGRKGGLATKHKNARPGLDPKELPPLRTHEDAQGWLETIGRAVATGRLSDRQAQAAIKAVSEWVKAEGERLTATVIEELKGEVAELKRQFQTPTLRTVP